MTDHLNIDHLQTEHCAAEGCEWRHLSSGTWKRLPRTQRAELTAAGIRRRGAYGMCEACYVRDGRPVGAQPRRAGVPVELVLLDWNWLHEAGELSEHDSLASRVRFAAPRIGMTPDALEKALERAGIVNPLAPRDMPATSDNHCRTCHTIGVAIGYALSDLRFAAHRRQTEPGVQRWEQLCAKASADLRRQRTDLAEHHLRDHAEQAAA